MGLKKIVRGATIIATIAAMGLAGPAAMADTTPPDDRLQAEYAHGLFDAPDGIDVDVWDEVLSDAQQRFGDGDKTYVEALQEVTPLAAATYCNQKTRPWSAMSGESIHVPNFNGSKNCMLEQGINSNGVVGLQYALHFCYGKNIASDGAFGPATYSALIQVQQSLGIAADGVYGPQTRDKMRFRVSVGANTCAPASQAIWG